MYLMTHLDGYYSAMIMKKVLFSINHGSMLQNMNMGKDMT
jgi:hypothetical protein